MPGGRRSVEWQMSWVRLLTSAATGMQGGVIVRSRGPFPLAALDNWLLNN